MIGINKAPIVDGLETVMQKVTAGISTRALGRMEIIGVIIQNPLLLTDGSANTGVLFVGNATNQIYCMLPGQESPLFYAEDLKDIYVRLNFPATNPNGIITSAFLNDGGTLYTALDVLTLHPIHGFGTNATIRVDTVDGGGTILTKTLLTGGTGFQQDDVITPTGGTGSGAEFIVALVDTVTPETADINLIIYRRRKGGRQ